MGGEGANLIYTVTGATLSRCRDGELFSTFCMMGSKSFHSSFLIYSFDTKDLMTLTISLPKRSTAPLDHGKYGNLK